MTEYEKRERQAFKEWFSIPENRAAHEARTKYYTSVDSRFSAYSGCLALSRHCDKEDLNVSRRRVQRPSKATAVL